jgi:hypothetical protein
MIRSNKFTTLLVNAWCTRAHDERQRIKYQVIYVSEKGKRVYLLISTTVFILSCVLYVVKPAVYRILLGNFNPLAVVLLLAIMGYFLLGRLSCKGFSAYKPVCFSARLSYLGGAALLGLGMIFVDYLAHLPDDINILFPHSLLYYPIFGYSRGIVSHASSVPRIHPCWPFHRAWRI